MAEYPFVSTHAQADAVALLHLNNAIMSMMQAAVVAQLKTGVTGPVTIDIVALKAVVDTGVQQLATDTQQSVVHPVTGVLIQPLAAILPA